MIDETWCAECWRWVEGCDHLASLLVEKQIRGLLASTKFKREKCGWHDPKMNELCGRVAALEEVIAILEHHDLIGKTYEE